MPKILIVLLLIAFGFISCKPKHESFACGDDNRNPDYGKVFLTGPQMLNSIHFKDILKMSGIHSEGYTLMITGDNNLNASYIKRFDEMLNFNQLHANHIIGIRKSDRITPANCVAIENARLIFLVLTSRDYHNAVLEDEKLRNSFVNAWQSGATIVAVAYGADILGGQVAVLKDADQGNKRYGIRNGFGVVPGVLIGQSSFYQDERQWIAEEVNNSNAYLGLGEHAMVQVCGSEIVVIEPGSLLISKNGNQLDKSLFLPGAKVSLK